MPLWGANTNDESKPKNLTEEEKSRVFASERGWEITRADGKTEVLVAIRGLAGADATSSKLGQATISQVFFVSSSYIADHLNEGKVRVVWNEKVTPTTTGTLLIKNSTGADITATRYGNTTSNFIEYRFTTPIDPASVLTIPAQSITQGINDYGQTTVTSQLVVVTSNVVNAAAAKSGSTGVALTTNTPAQITSVYFGANSYSTGNTAASVIVVWSEDVTATTTGTMTVMRSTTTSDVALTATRYGAANGSSVTFRFTAPSTTGITLSITSQTISMGIRDADSNANTSDLTIALADVIGAAGDGGSTSIVTTV